MLKKDKEDLIYNEPPRKKIKINIESNQSYNQFKGQFVQQPDFQLPLLDKKNQATRNISSQIQNKRYKQIFQFIKNAQKKCKKICDIQQKIKKQQNLQIKTEQQRNKVVKKQSQNTSSKQKKQKKSNQKISKNINKNWQQFLNSNSKSSKITSSKITNNQFIAMDCQFVKSGQQQILGRVSLVNQQGKCIYDSFVKPQNRITDYVSNISGITYTHIKNAPKTAQIIEKIKKIIKNKFIIGHTIWKDLQVCGLKNWKGYKALIDISEFNDYKQKNGRLISLKNLSSRYLGKSIQEGIHSSVIDAQATMNLFMIRKRQIMKQFKLIN